MSITITGAFPDSREARHAADRLRHRGFAVSGLRPEPESDVNQRLWPLTAGDRSFGNQAISGLPPALSGRSVEQSGQNLVSVLTDDTEAAEARRLMEAFGGSIL